MHKEQIQYREAVSRLRNVHTTATPQGVVPHPTGGGNHLHLREGMSLASCAHRQPLSHTKNACTLLRSSFSLSLSLHAQSLPNSRCSLTSLHCFSQTQVAQWIHPGPQGERAMERSSMMLLKKPDKNKKIPIQYVCVFILVTHSLFHFIIHSRSRLRATRNRTHIRVHVHAHTYSFICCTCTSTHTHTLQHPPTTGRSSGCGWML